MKKYLRILSVLIVAAIGLIYLIKWNMNESAIPKTTNAVMRLQTATNPIIINPNIPIKVPRPTPAVETSEPIVEMTNALTATNLEQWTNAIKSLKPLAGFQFDQHWLVEQPGRTNGIPIVLNVGNKTIQYSAVLISILAKNDTGDIMEVEMQTPNMNIDETRELGLQICDMLNIDPKNFLAWCGQVGNRWLDQPLFGDGNGHHHYNYSFHLLHSYNDEKPWVINFMIIPNP
jgi:hypothetical protein